MKKKNKGLINIIENFENDNEDLKEIFESIKKICNHQIRTKNLAKSTRKYNFFGLNNYIY